MLKRIYNKYKKRIYNKYKKIYTTNMKNIYHKIRNLYNIYNHETSIKSSNTRKNSLPALKRKIFVPILK